MADTQVGAAPTRPSSLPCPLPAPRDDEAGLLDFAWEPKPNSRLTCQLVASEELDGLVLFVPEQQL